VYPLAAANCRNAKRRSFPMRVILRRRGKVTKEVRAGC
jgi:hypothetical protein